jgi:hypothetical protein
MATQDNRTSAAADTEWEQLIAKLSTRLDREEKAELTILLRYPQDFDEGELEAFFRRVGGRLQ